MMLSRGSRGDNVSEWQAALRAAGFAVVVDGDFGIETETATRAYQQRLGVPADGIVGPQTAAAHNAAMPSLKFELWEEPQETRKGIPWILALALGFIGTAALLMDGNKKKKSGK